jgi:hypothetical protein
MLTVCRGFREPSSAEPPLLVLPCPLPGPGAGGADVWGCASQLGANPAGFWSPILHCTAGWDTAPTRVRVSGSPPGQRGRCRRGRAGGARARGRAARSERRARGREPPRTGGLAGGLRSVGRGDGGRAAIERAGGVAAAGGARGRSPLLHGAAWVPRAAPRRAPQGSQSAGDGGALPGLGDHPGLHQPPPAAARQGESSRGPAGEEALSRDFAARRKEEEAGPAAQAGTHCHTFLGWCCVQLCSQGCVLTVRSRR